jgi:restriction system protein
MARRNKKPPDAATILVATVGVFCVFQLVVAQVRGVNLVLPILLIGIGLAIVIQIVVPIWRRNNVLERADTITDEHINALVRQRTIQVHNDSYGKPMLDKWHSEVSYFITHHVRPALRPSQRRLLDGERMVILQRISRRVADVVKQGLVFTAVSASMPTVEFEEFCAEKLRACGWKVRLTPLCRDQGVDVIAEKNGVRVVLQCELYSNTVGNKAVREIAAGKVHQQAEYGVVVTNSMYASSAKELAATNRIWLLHHTDLPQLEQILGMPTRQ